MHADLENKIADLQRQIGNAKALAETYEHCEVAKPKELDFVCSLDPDVSIEVPKVRFCVYDCKDLATIVPVIRSLRSQGHKVAKPHSDSSDCNCRTYFLDGIELIVYLSKATDSTCKYVQVGVKEVPVMEVRCGDDDALLNHEASV